MSTITPFQSDTRVDTGAETDCLTWGMEAAPLHLFTGHHTSSTTTLTKWEDRALHLQSQPCQTAQGAALLTKSWGSDRFIMTLSAVDLQQLCSYLQFVCIAAHQEIIGQDELGDFMIVVLEGTVAVDRVQPWGGRSRLAEVRAGDLLGEMSLLDAGARFSACTTLTPCIIAVISAAEIDRMMSESPRLGLVLMASLSRRLSLRLRQVSARLSALLSRG